MPLLFLILLFWLPCVLFSCSLLLRTSSAPFVAVAVAFAVVVADIVYLVRGACLLSSLSSALLALRPCPLPSATATAPDFAPDSVQTHDAAFVCPVSLSLSLSLRSPSPCSTVIQVCLCKYFDRSRGQPRRRINGMG